MAFGGDNAESYYDDGLTFSMKGDLKRAVECFEIATKKEPGYLGAYHQLGKCYLRMGDAQRAVNMLKQVVDRKPDNAPFRIDLGAACLAAGHLAEARAQFQFLLNDAPSMARAYLGLAQTDFAEAQWNEAVQNAQSAIMMSDRNFGALFVLGRAGMLSDYVNEAVAALGEADALLEKSIELTPKQPEGHYLRGEVAFVAKKYSTAIEYYREAEENAQQGRYYAAFGESFSFVDILAKQGLCYRQLSQYERAAEMGRRALSIDPEHKIGKALSELEPSE